MWLLAAFDRWGIFTKHTSSLVSMSGLVPAKSRSPTEPSVKLAHTLSFDRT